jgi:adenine-specific DNA-methyltransferase
LGNEIFGEKNFVGQWNWFKSATPPNLSHKIRKNLEYLLGYEKSRTNTKYKGAFKSSSSDDPLTKPQNTIKELVFPPGSINFRIKEGEIEPGIYGTVKYPNKLKNKAKIQNNTNINEVIFENRFVWTQPKLEEEIENKTRINCSKSLVLSYKKSNYAEEVPLNLIDEGVGVDTTEEAGKQLFNIFGKKVFDYPKPVSLIKYILKFKKSDHVLDFFAGSGTTLQAVIEANEEENFKRKCVIVTNNENKIAEEITYKRNKLVIQGYTDSEGNNINGLKNNNLRYYQTDFVERETSLSNKRKLTQLSTELLCIKEDCYTEVTSHLENASWHKYFTNGSGNYVYVIYDDMYIEDGVSHLSSFIEGNPEAKIKVYVFANGPYPYTEEFESIANNIELAALPDAIYKAYQNILPKQNKEFIPELEEESPVEFDQ